MYAIIQNFQCIFICLKYPMEHYGDEIKEKMEKKEEEERKLETANGIFGMIYLR